MSFLRLSAYIQFTFFIKLVTTCILTVCSIDSAHNFETTGAKSGRCAADTYNVRGEAFWLDDVECYGDENLLLDCDHAELGVHDCSREEVAAVTCLGVYYITLYNQNIATVFIVYMHVHG